MAHEHVEAVSVEWRLVGPSHQIVRLAFDADLGTVVLLCQGAGVQQRELWAWQDDRFVRIAEGLLPGYQYGQDLHGVTVASAPGRATPLLAGILGSDGIVLTSRDRPGEERVLRVAAQPGAAGSRFVLAHVCLLGPDLLAVKANGGVYRAEGDVLVPVADPFPKLTESTGLSDSLLSDVVVDPVGGRLVATDFAGCGYTFTVGTGWQPDGRHESPLSEVSLAWNPVRQRVEMLRGPAGGLTDIGPMWMHGWDEQDAGPPPDSNRLLPLERNYQIAFDEAAEEWVALGDTRVSRCRPGDPWRATALPLVPPQRARGGQFTATTTGPLYVVDGGNASTWRLEGDAWVQGPWPAAGGSSTYPHIAAVPEGIATLDDGGALRLRTPDHAETRLVPPWGGLNGLTDDDLVSLVHDSYADRLVLWHGRRSRTWIGRGPGWRQATGNHPPEGVAVLCATSVGVYCLCGDELWLLDPDDVWAPVGSAAGHGILSLACSEAIAALWSVSTNGVAVWREGVFHHVMNLPEPVALDDGTPDRVHPFSPPSRVTFDPVAQRLLILGPSGTWELPLADLAVHAPGLPTADSNAAPADEAGEAPTPSVSARSCYILEISCGPGATPLGELYAYPELDHIRACLDQTVLNPTGGIYRYIVAGSGTLYLWVVQEGILTQGTDLRAFLRGPNGFAPEGNVRDWLWDLLRSFEPEFDDDVETDQPVATNWLTIDWPAVAAETPQLRGRRVGPGGVRVRVDGRHPDPDVDTYLEHGEFLTHGFNDLSSFSDRPIADFTDPDDHSTWRDPNDWHDDIDDE